MARRNLLEAFQEIADAKAERPAEAAPSGAVPPAAPPGRPTSPEPRAAGPGAPLPLGLDSLNRSALIALVVVFALGFLFGRWSGSGSAVVEAGAGGEAPGTAATQAPAGSAPRANEPAAPSASPQAPASPADRALLDPANRFTVQVVTYNNTPAQRRLADDLVAHLRQSGVPAAEPVVRGNHTLVLAGAAPTRDALEPLLAQIRAMRGPRGRAGEFDSALVMTIDSFVSR